MIPLVQCFERMPELLVPIPSNRNSVLERGYNPAELIAREISAGIPGARWSNLLGRLRETKDQSKLTPNQRQLNQSGSMAARVGKGRVLLIDDVVTTGSTLLEAKETLENSGYFVEGFITFAETEAKRCTLTTQASLPADGGTSWN
jgi:predicted amidophosphoribosyltransferase